MRLCQGYGRALSTVATLLTTVALVMACGPQPRPLPYPDDLPRPRPPFLNAAQIVFGPKEPPVYEKGVYCTPHGDLVLGVQTTDHPCACKNMLRESKDGCCDVPVTNDSACKQWCHEAHCSCPKMCIPGKPDETEPPQQ